MHNLDLILILATGFIGALALGYVTHRLGWSPIVGFLLAGVLAGPYTPGFVANRQLAEQLAEVGVILLMFGVGLQFHLKDLLAVKGIAISGALVRSAIITVLGGLAFRAFGWDWSSGVIFGLTLSVASTVVLIRVLTENGALQSPTGRIAIGWVVVEDIFTVFVLVLLPVVFPSSGVETASLPAAIGTAAIKLTAFIGLTLVAGGRFIPWLFTKIAETHSRELFTLSVLAIALGIALASAYFFGVSMALGAFLAGIGVGQSQFSARAGAEALPMRDAFAVMFFLSVGMLFDPVEALKTPFLILATLAIVMIGKPLTAIIIVAALGYSSRIGLGVALALAQIGEFSFLLATVGRQIGALPDAAMNSVVAVAILSMMLNPLLYRCVDPLEAFLARHPLLWKLLNRRTSREDSLHKPEADSAAHRAVIVGYGPIGQIVYRILRQWGIDTTIIEMNIDTHRKLRADGHKVIYGDANQEKVLDQAGVARAASFILSASGSVGATEAIRVAREMNPRIHVVARADYLGQADLMRRAGADEVFSGEGEVALAMADSMLRTLGATPEQSDEAREQIRTKLLHRKT
jgi:CPA2 family monovalent cation:H+ antiporter-2